MKKPLLMVLLCLPVIGLADSAFAALGETEAQIEKRYGPAVVTSITDAPPDVYEKYHLRAYLMEPYYITVWFNKSGVAEYEQVEKVRVPSLNNQTRQVAQEFGDQEIQDFLHANSSYDGPFVEEAKAAADEKDYRVWYSQHHVKALAELMFIGATYSNGEKAIVQILRVETEEWVQWLVQESKKRKSQH